VGIQILGPWLEDATPIFVAGALEKTFGFRVPMEFEYAIVVSPGNMC
jgi:hypothetical protein